MYITGNISDFSSRLHSCTATTGEIAQYQTEYSNYSGIYDQNTKNKLNKEGARLSWTLAQNPTNLTGQYFV